jgi:glycosyltransferase involved in cell wall biosynthesis
MVVDNHPDGRARAVCERLSSLLPVGLDFFEERQRGASFARNRAVREALNRNADFVAFLDDDDLPQPDWLLHLVKKQQQTQADIVGSVFPPAINPDWPNWLKKSPLFDEPKRKVRTKYGVPSNFGIGSTLLRREIIERLQSQGPVFTSDFGMIGCEDADFFARAKKCGATFSLAEKAIVNRSYEEQRLTRMGLLRDAFRIGNCIRQLMEKYSLPAEVSRRKWKAYKRLCLGFSSLIIRFFSKTLMMRSLYQISKEAGFICGRGGKK